MPLIDTNFAQSMTEIDNSEVLEFMIEAIIKKIEKIIGYPLAKEETTDYIEGLNTREIWLPRKPVSNVSEVVVFNNSLEPEEYNIRNAEDTPHIVLKNEILPTCEEAKVIYTAGFADGELDADIKLLIFNLINDFKSQLDNGDIKSYKFEKVSYKFTSYLEKQDNFYNQVINTFGEIL